MYTNISTTTEQLGRGKPYPDFTRTYEQWYFELLQRLVYRHDIYKVAETTFLKPIESCIPASLTKFEVVSTPNVPMIVDTVIKLPPVKWIELTYIQYGNGYNDR